MEYVHIRSIQDPYFAAMHQLMGRIFPPEEVLAFELWEEPLKDPNIQVYAAIHNGEVVGATEYRYVPHLQVAMTDFTIIREPGLGIGRFLYVNREKDLKRLERESGTRSLGMFAEIYDPEETTDIAFGQSAPMHPAVRREVLSHLGYRKLDIAYVHPSWDHEGKAVTGLDLGFRPAEEETEALPSSVVVSFLRWYYEALPNKPQEWHRMMDELSKRGEIALLPL